MIRQESRVVGRAHGGRAVVRGLAGLVAGLLVFSAATSAGPYTVFAVPATGAPAIGAPATSAPATGNQTDEPRITGRLEEGEAIDVLYLWGSPAEQGFAEGYLFAPRIQEVFAEFVLSPGVLPEPGLWDKTLRPLFRQRIRPGGDIDARIKGMVAGMSARLPEDQRPVAGFGRPLDELDFVGVLALIDVAGFMCSSFVAWDDVLEDGVGPLVGRNLDYVATEGMLAQTILKVHVGDDKRASWLSIGWPGFLGCITGISQHGISVAIHDVPGERPDNNLKFAPRAAALAALLEALRPGEDLAHRAAEFVRQKHYAFGMNAMLAWTGGTPGGAVLEVDTDVHRADGVSVREPQEGAFIACSNHHRSRQPAAECRRYDALQQGCAQILAVEADPLDLHSAWELLRRASKGDTLYSCVFDLETGALRFQRRTKPGGEMADAVELDWQSLLLRGEKLSEVLR